MQLINNVVYVPIEELSEVYNIEIENNENGKYISDLVMI